ncbi:MAG: sugar phosphate nucleotidyltransferase [Elusimicrobiales bacterium]|nr:sugar phosphate nucleotidyltransferase [Elusimicrobiales bacterium]
MKAVIIAGGCGTRLRPFTFSIPKPLLPVGEKPILEYTVGRLRSMGIRDITLSLGYGAELIEAYFGDGRKFGVGIRYTRERKPLGTAGPLRLARGLRSPFLVMNGDILTRLDFKKMMRFHEKSGADLTVAARKYADRLPFGTVSADGDVVTGITEKPVTHHLVSAGIYIVSPAAVRRIPPGRFFTMPDLVKALLKAGRPVRMYGFSDYWLGIERVSQLEEAAHEARHWDR